MLHIVRAQAPMHGVTTGQAMRRSKRRQHAPLRLCALAILCFLDGQNDDFVLWILGQVSRDSPHPFQM